MTVRLGLVGYGAGGRWFHAPYIQASERIQFAGVVTRSPARIAEVQAELPGVPIFATLTDLLDSGVDAVTISTPPATRRELVLEAVARGVHVIADKPFAQTAAGGQELADAAAAAGVLLNVFHNRRWDTDIVTAQSVLDSGELGTVQRFDRRFDLDEPGSLEAGPHGGLLRDLGSHVVDQALFLLGPAATISAQLDWIDLPEGRTDSAFVTTIEHTSGAHSHISATKLAHLRSSELRIIGSAGSYVSDYRDIQAAATQAGERPVGKRATWGYEDESRWGVLSTDSGARRIPSLQGDYTRLYDAFAEAIETGDSDGPVPVDSAIRTLAALDAVRMSAAEHRTIALP